MTTPAAATEARPLTPREQAQLNALLARQAATPAARKPYVALTSLSKPRYGRKDTDPNDLVRRGEIVHLTDEEAASYLRYGPGTGRLAPAVVALEEARANPNFPYPLPRQLSGPIMAPPPPQPRTDQARPDPLHSSHLIDYGTPAPVLVPEAREPQPDSETREPDALDLPPTGSVAATAAAQPPRG